MINDSLKFWQAICLTTPKALAEVTAKSHANQFNSLFIIILTYYVYPCWTQFQKRQCTACKSLYLSHSTGDGAVATLTPAYIKGSYNLYGYLQNRTEFSVRTCCILGRRGRYD
jgi:hypothetical protein